MDIKVCLYLQTVGINKRNQFYMYRYFYMSCKSCMKSRNNLHLETK